MTPFVSSLSSDAFPVPLMGYWDLAGDRFTTSAPFIYDDREKGVKVRVPQGFDTDFHSIPRVVWAWFPPTQFPSAAVVHDALYRKPSAYVNGVKVTLDRGQCDDLYRRVLHLSGCRKTKRLAAWSGLRLGGWAAWNRYRERDA